MSTDLCSVCGNVRDVSTFVVSQEDGKFCSKRCLQKFTFRKIRKQLAEVYLKHDLIPAQCQLNSLPGYHCGMIAAIEVATPGNPVVRQFCGKKHEALALALKAKGEAQLRLDYLEKRFSEMKEVYRRRLDHYAETLKVERNRVASLGTDVPKEVVELSVDTKVSVDPVSSPELASKL